MARGGHGARCPPNHAIEKYLSVLNNRGQFLSCSPPHSIAPVHFVDPCRKAAKGHEENFVIWAASETSITDDFRRGHRSIFNYFRKLRI
jgi:hypothetical protein